MTGPDLSVVKTLAAFFVVRSRKWDSQNYPYFVDSSMWETHIMAHAHLTAPAQTVVLRHVDLTVSGRIVYNDRTIYNEGKWVSPEHDPRCADPEYRDYIRLKA